MPPMDTTNEQCRKMLAGEFYEAWDPYLVEARKKAHTICRDYNSTNATGGDEVQRNRIRELFGKVGENPYIEPPFKCDYGANIEIGDNVYMNFNTTILDCAKVTIGSNVMFAPNVSLYAATHPTDPVLRNQGKEMAYPITIGKGSWIGGNVVILPGITIGEGVTVGAGSVVTKDVPDYCVVVGNPARIVKRLEKPAEDAPTMKLP
ncbi:hypothetical protein HK097_009469 [Rhizophlyctis rosea]|uniref:Maltose/galactoside acetyltransferase domain-containing protein n=1 Tax=Rhizophlyctis rosea TaxID=64517 RepID=A0AAD5X0E6_9FUNG|nr:hypothetical protein HK097_009469 [Rhizophlyctis rosea]